MPWSSGIPVIDVSGKVRVFAGRPSPQSEKPNNRIGRTFDREATSVKVDSVKKYQALTVLSSESPFSIAVDMISRSHALVSISRGTVGDHGQIESVRSRACQYTQSQRKEELTRLRQPHLGNHVMGYLALRWGLQLVRLYLLIEVTVSCL